MDLSGWGERGERGGLSVRLDNRSGNSTAELDLGRLIGVFGKEMEEVIKQILEVNVEKNLYTCIHLYRMMTLISFF